jgi:hypothetical protein
MGFLDKPGWAPKNAGMAERLRRVFGIRSKRERLKEIEQQRREEEDAADERREQRNAKRRKMVEARDAKKREWFDR